MDQDLCVRELTPDDDVAVLERIAVAAWTPIFAEYRRMVGDELFEVLYSDWAENKAEQIRNACAPGNPTRVFVAEQDGVPVGFVSFTVRPDGVVATIGNNAVDPARQGQGLGVRVYNHVLDLLREQGCKAVRVTTGGDPSHAPARRAYEKAGFGSPVPSVMYHQLL